MKIDYSELNGGGASVVNTNTSFNQNTWYHIVYTRNANTKKQIIYVDGILHDSITYSGNLNSNQTLNRLFVERSKKITQSG